MIYRKLDANGDYVFGQKQQNFWSGTVAVSQAIKTRLLLLLGEWWEDTATGTPLFQEILTYGGDFDKKSAVDLIVQDRILNTPNVTTINFFNSIIESRQYICSCNVATEFGDATVEVVL